MVAAKTEKKYSELQYLQWKVRNEINTLERENAKATHHIFKLNRSTSRKFAKRKMV
jgi:hypothetical protein